VHLLLADAVWIVLVRLSAASLALGAPRADVKLKSELSLS
jgi:cytochrome c oxidase assembly protein subunit 15